MRRRSGERKKSIYDIRRRACARRPHVTTAAGRLKAASRSAADPLDGLGEILVRLARGAAALLDLGQLLLGEVELALDHVGLAQVLAHQRVLRVERHRLLVVADAFFQLAELARR